MGGRKRKTESKLFHIGKGMKHDGLRVGFMGEPNTNVDTYRKKDGSLHRRRKIGNDGFALKDYDMADSHKAHDIAPMYGRNPKDREPTKKERREIEKAKRKRRFWRD